MSTSKEVTLPLSSKNGNSNLSELQTNAALIKDLTGENTDILEDGHSMIRQTQECFSKPRGLSKVAAQNAESQGNGLIGRSVPGSTVGEAGTVRQSVVKVERQDHDYGNSTRNVVLSSLIMTPKENEHAHGKKKAAASSAVPLHKESTITRVKNISELKKVTPKLKLLSPEVTKLSQLTRMSIQSSVKGSSNREASVEPSRPQLKNYCRTCAGLKVPLVDIFSEKGMQMRLNQQMKHLEDIKQEDSLSTQMCMDCICDLKMSYKFFMQIKKAEVKLHSIYSSLQASTLADERSKNYEHAVKGRTSFSSRKSESERSDLSLEFSSQATNKIREKESTEIRVKIEPESEFTLQSSDNDSIEEFDPEDPPFQPDTTEPWESEAGSEYIPETWEHTENLSSEIHAEQYDNNPTATEINDSTIMSKKAQPESKPNVNEPSRDVNKTVYQYDTSLKAYIKIEPLDESKNIESPPLIQSRLSESADNGSNAETSPSKHPNILKRKISVRKDFLGSPAASVSTSDSTFVMSGPKDIKKPRLNVENAVNVTKENEEGIMYVTVKGTKPNEMLLVKVKKMDKPGESKKEDRKKHAGPSLDVKPSDKVIKRIRDDSFGARDKDHSINRSKALDIREQIIANQIEEYKKKREKVLGGSAGLPNALKFEGGMIRFVNPIEASEPSPTIKVEPGEEQDGTQDEKSIKAERGKDLSESGDRNESQSDRGKSTICYNNTGEYLLRLAKLKRKWEEAKKKKESLQRELAESYTEGNLEKLARILGEKEKNLREFQEYLKQRKIVITRLKDEDIISLYEDRNNTSTKKNLPDLIDSTTPEDYIAQENYLECDYCPETFALCDLLEEHLKTHDYKLMYYCEDCQEEFSSIKAKRSHNVGCIKTLICKYCDLMLDSKGKKRQHEQKHVDSIYGQLCEVCGEKFKHQGTLDQHFKTQHMTWEKIYECPKCPKKFAFKQKLSFHLKSVHTSLRAYLCEDCGADFKNPASLRHHRIRKHHPTGNKRECPVCNKLVPFYSLSKHMYTHKAYTIQCPHCDKMFKNSSTLKQHVRIHEDQRQYRCDTCGVGFNRRDGLRLHMRVHQKTDSRALKECSCQICSEKFPNHSMLVIHRNRVHKDGRQYTCHICNRSMLSTRSLEWHMSHIHNETLADRGDGPGGGSGGGEGLGDEAESAHEKKRVSCVHCEKTFKTEMILRTHIKNTHMEKDPTKCLDCELTFTSDVRLRHHMMVAHNRLEGTLPCPHCSKRFVNQLRLKTHMISHSEDRPYTCEICGFNLKTKIQLIKHHQNRHSDERPLQCRYCPWRCKQVSALVCHERTHTNERPYSCIVCRQRFKYLGDKNKHERRHESLGGSGFKRIVAGRNLKQSKNVKREPHHEDTSTDQDHLDYENHEDDEQFIEEQEHNYHQDEDQDHQQQQQPFHESDEAGQQYEQSYQQEYEETSREASEAAEVIMNMEDTTVYTEEVTADNIETAEMITDEMTNQILQSGTVVHLQQQDDTGKIQVIPVMLSLPDLSDSSAEVNLATASIMYNN